MNDLISRKAAIDAVGDVHPLDYNGQAILYRIKALPTIDPVKWIPVSERPPKEGVQVLVTDDAGGLATIDVDCGYFDEEYGRFEWFHSQNVTAWMPLPEPWKGEKDDSDKD